MKREKIAKVLSHRGIASRREAERMVLSGRVCVDDILITNVAETIDPDAAITVDGQWLPALMNPRLWAFYKPAGCITSRNDELGRTTIYDLLPEYLQTTHYIGRLDYNTEGLLLLTNSATLKKEWEDPKTAMPRHYRVRIFGHLLPEHERAMQKPMIIEGIHYQPWRVTCERQTDQHMWLSLVLHEGKNREIRRIFDYFGYQVTRLIRTHYGDYALKNMPLTSGEVMELAL